MSFKSKDLKEQPVKGSNGNQIYNAYRTEKKDKVEVEQTSICFKNVYVFDVYLLSRHLQSPSFTAISRSTS